MPKRKADFSDLFGEGNNNRRQCERCDRNMSYYTDLEKEHELWLCWGCGKFNGNTKVDDDFTDMILVDPALILELIEQKSLIPGEQ
jgi:hypothetical protein